MGFQALFKFVKCWGRVLSWAVYPQVFHLECDGWSNVYGTYFSPA